MTSSQNEQIRGLFAQERWPEIIASLESIPPSSAAELMGSLTDEQQQALFRLLPVDMAAGLLNHFPYYHQYILLHARPPLEMRQVLDQMGPDDRMRFFDELPEEAWRRLVDEIGEFENAAVPATPAPVPAPFRLPLQRPSQVSGVAGESPALEPVIEARAVERSFLQPDGKSVQVIAPLDLSVYPGTIVTLLGASGCGKSSLLRILSGLAAPSSGKVYWHGRPISGVLPNVAIVFQSFALFPWLTVLENVEAPLLAQGMDAAARQQRALQAIDAVGLKGFETAYPKELSGGMKQRVGFARALVVEPEVLFMDEPFSALDVLTAENLRGELLELWLTRKIVTKTIFIVTHNIEEAVLLADRVIVLGRNPARIRADFRIALPQPRDRKSPQFLLYVDFIYKVMTKPEATGLTPPTPHETHIKTQYPLLPHARPGGIAGLLEVLAESGGEEDLYHLAERLRLDVDDLLPILDAGVLLGFATMEEGDAAITPAGQKFSEADITARKSLFREAALARIPLLQHIENALLAKSNHSLPLELFRDILEEHYPENEMERQLETVLYWGRYCEMFSYDSESGRLSLIPGSFTARQAAPGGSA